MRVALLAIGLTAACGSPSGTPDDAPAGGGDGSAIIIDAPPPPVGQHYHFVIDSLVMPATTGAANATGFDLDGTGGIDNRFGQLLAALAGMGVDVQTGPTKAVDTGVTMILVDVQALDLTTAANAGVTTFLGKAATPAPCNGTTDTVCRHHLTGSATFTLTDDLPSSPLSGAIAGAAYTGGPGNLIVSIPVITGTPMVTTLAGAHVSTHVAATALTTGILAGAIAQVDINAQIVPALVSSLMTIVSANCGTNPPNCGCTNGTTGKTLITNFDANQDCLLDANEIRTNATLAPLLAPDVVIDGQSMLSIGVGFTAVGATY